MDRTVTSDTELISNILSIPALRGVLNIEPSLNIRLYADAKLRCYCPLSGLFLPLFSIGEKRKRTKQDELGHVFSFASPVHIVGEPHSIQILRAKNKKNVQDSKQTIFIYKNGDSENASCSRTTYPYPVCGRLEYYIVAWLEFAASYEVS